MRMMILTAVAAAIAAPAYAELAKVTSEGQFEQLVSGKTLTRPMVKLTVSPNGQIAGRGSLWDIEGTWAWKDGYFCRDLSWGGDDLGYNCQEVQASANGQIKFTSDKGAGDSASFTLR